MNNGKHRCDHRFSRTAGDRYFTFRIKFHGVVFFYLTGKRFTKILCSPGDCILVEVILHRVTRSLLEFGRAGKIGKTLCKVDRTILQGETGHFTYDRFGEVICPRRMGRKKSLSSIFY